MRGDAWKAIAAALLAAGADPRARGADGLPPLHLGLILADLLLGNLQQAKQIWARDWAKEG